MRAQRLVGAPYASPAKAVESLGAVQAQEYREAKWSLAQRCGHPTEAEVERDLVAGRFLRTHVLRPTWHFVIPEDIRWMLALTGPRVLTAYGNWFREHGLDDVTLRRYAEVCVAALGESPLSRAQLRDALLAAGIELDGQTVGHLTIYLEAEALVCNGPHEGIKPSYRLLADWAKDGREFKGDEALTELAGRYFSSHGPATLVDYCWWSGLKVKDARRGLELCGDRFEEIEDEEGRTWFAEPSEWATPPPEIEGALMLGSFDELSVAYKDLRTVSPSGEPGRVLPLAPILIDGRLVGSWKRKAVREAVRIQATVFAPLDASGEAALEAEAARYGEHLGIPVDLSIAVGEPVAAA